MATAFDRPVFNAWFYSQDMQLIPVAKSNPKVAASSGFTVEYDFSFIPDMELKELVYALIDLLPQKFVFVRTAPRILSFALEQICRRLRPDIEFMDPIVTLDQGWFNLAYPELLPSNISQIMEMQTACKLADAGTLCGLVGTIPRFYDLGFMHRKNSVFIASTPDWQVIEPYSTISYRLLAEHRPDIFCTNFCQLLARAVMKKLDFANNWDLYRMTNTEIFWPRNLAFLISDIAHQDFSEVTDNVYDTPSDVVLVKPAEDYCILPLDALK